MNALTFCNTSQTIIDNNSIASYVTDFNSFLNQSAEAVLKMGKVVFNASKNLGKQDFLEFCTAVRLSASGSAISKLKKIGEKYDRLIQHKDSLPQAWTTLYHLARVDESNFEKGLQQNFIHQTMTANELKLVDAKLFASKKHNSDKDPVDNVEPEINNDITILADKIIDPQVRKQLIAELAMICSKFDCEIVGNE